MPIHDWTRVTAGTFHDFHSAWIAELRRALNSGLLPEGYYAQAEQAATQIIPDVITLQEPDGDAPVASGDEGGLGLAVAVVPPRVTVSDQITEATLIASRRRRLVIRHATGDRIIAVLEIVSPGNKEKRSALDAFVNKVMWVLDEGYHLLLVDPFPPDSFDPTGMHGAVWERLGGAYAPPANKPLTLAAYAALGGGAVNCYVEPTAVGTALIPMPLFLDPGHYINVPLEATYQSAYEGEPLRWKRVLEAGA